mmetsp:Transcript_124025/g.358681  ORF Transcript_124025/g.358681 Transcript_124025/m.358681 type:complete len:256 (+) Transcript_124025:1238-2005(+)
MQRSSGAERAPPGARRPGVVPPLRLGAMVALPPAGLVAALPALLAGGGRRDPQRQPLRDRGGQGWYAPAVQRTRPGHMLAAAGAAQLHSAGRLSSRCARAVQHIRAEGGPLRHTVVVAGLSAEAPVAAPHAQTCDEGRRASRVLVGHYARVLERGDRLRQQGGISRHQLLAALVRSHPHWSIHHRMDLLHRLHLPCFGGYRRQVLLRAHFHGRHPSGHEAMEHLAGSDAKDLDQHRVEPHRDDLGNRLRGSSIVG